MKQSIKKRGMEAVRVISPLSPASSLPELYILLPHVRAQRWGPDAASRGTEVKLAHLRPTTAAPTASSRLLRFVSLDAHLFLPSGNSLTLFVKKPSGRPRAEGSDY